MVKRCHDECKNDNLEGCVTISNAKVTKGVHVLKYKKCFICIMFFKIAFIYPQQNKPLDIPAVFSSDYSMISSMYFSSKVINADIADESDDYVILTRKNSATNTLTYFSSDNTELWNIDIDALESRWANISSNGEIIMIQGWESLKIYNKTGTNLFNKQTYMISHFLSPNGKYFLEQKGDGYGYMRCYLNTGKLLSIQIPDKYNSPLFYSKFTSDNKILALFVGQNTNQSKPKKTRGKIRKQTVTKLVPEISSDSHLILINPENNEIEWIRKIKNGRFYTHGFQLNQCAISQEHILLFNDNPKKINRGFYCYDNAGGLIWYKSMKEIKSDGIPYVSSLIINLEEKEVCIYDGRYQIYFLELESGDFIRKIEISKNIVRSNSFRIYDIVGSKIVFAPSYIEDRMKNNYIYDSQNINATPTLFDSGIFMSKTQSIIINNDFRIVLERNGVE